MTGNLARGTWCCGTTSVDRGLYSRMVGAGKSGDARPPAAGLTRPGGTVAPRGTPCRPTVASATQDKSRFIKIAASRKPNSVSAAAPCGAPADDDHSSSLAIAGGIKRPTRRLYRRAVCCGCAAGLLIWSCSVRGFACHPCYHGRGALLPHLFTLTRLSSQASRPAAFGQAVCFLCHCPSSCPDRALPGALPCGVRTFLSPSRSVHPASRFGGRPAIQAPAWASPRFRSPPWGLPAVARDAIHRARRRATVCLAATHSLDYPSVS